TAVTPPSTKVRRRKEPCRSLVSEKKIDGSELILLRSLRELRTWSAKVDRPVLRSLGEAGSSEPHVAVLEPLHQPVGEGKEQQGRNELKDDRDQAGGRRGHQRHDDIGQHEGQQAAGGVPDEQDGRLLSRQEAA